MFSPADQPHFTLTLPGIDHDFKVLAFRAREAISQCYRIELQRANGCLWRRAWA